MSGEFYLNGKDFSYRVLRTSEDYSIIVGNEKRDTFQMHDFEAQNHEVFKSRLNASLTKLFDYDVPDRDSLQIVAITSRLNALPPGTARLNLSEAIFLRDLLIDLAANGNNLTKKEYRDIISGTRTLLTTNTDPTALIDLQDIETDFDAKLLANSNARNVLFEEKAKELFILIRDKVNQFAGGITYDIGIIKMHEKVSMRVTNNFSKYYQYGLDYLQEDSWRDYDILKKYVYCDENNHKPNKITIDSAVLTFEGGVIKDVSVIATLIDQGRTFHLVFNNRLPFSVSSRTDITNLKKHQHALLFLSDDYEDSFNDYFIYWSDIFEYDFIPRLYTDDLSPKDCEIHLTRNKPIKYLPKDDTQEIINAKIFTDASGIFGDRPNGLIQAEFSRRILLNTRVFYSDSKLKNIWAGGMAIKSKKFIDDVFTKALKDSLYTFRHSESGEIKSYEMVKSAYTKYYSNYPVISKRLIPNEDCIQMLADMRNKKFIADRYWQFMSYVEPSLELSKVEENEESVRGLPDNGNMNPAHLDRLDILRYKTLSAGADLNVVKYTNPIKKYTWDWGIGLYLNRAPFGLDTSHIVSTEISPRVKILFNPETRYDFGFIIKTRFMREHHKDLQYTPMMTQDSNHSKEMPWAAVWDIGLVGTWRPNLASPNKGKFFLRANFITLFSDWQNNHWTLQFGYSFNFLSYKSASTLTRD